MVPFDPQKHQRRSIRLKGYDYAHAGAYFVTLVTWQRECLFGEVVDGKMQLSALGQIVHDEWMQSIAIRQEIRLYEDEFIVMPNHLHGIVWIIDPSDGVHPNDGVSGVGADGIRPEEQGACHAPQPNAPLVRADGVRPFNSVHPSDGVHPEGACHAPQPNAPQRALHQWGLRRLPRSLSSFVAGFKASVTRRAGRELNMTSIWQRNYYDRIIRNDQEFMNIWNYIDANPQKWQQDQLHPSAPPNRYNQG